MIVKNYFEDGMFGENSFVIIDEKTGEKAIVDPCFEQGFDYDEYNDMKYILLTHGHYDHVGDVLNIKEKYGAKIVCSKQEEQVLLNPKYNLSEMFGSKLVITPDITLGDGEKVMLGDIPVILILTAGHTVGSSCYVINDHIFTGDTVMQGTIGRTDLPTGDYKTIMKSIERLKALKNDYVLHCGHGSNTTLDKEKKYNEFFN